MAKLWGGRFTKGTDKAVEDFTSSIAFDARMYAEDIAGSKAHATMLAKQHIISDADRDAILAGLTKIKNQIDKGAVVYKVIDISDPQNEAITDKYEVTWSSLYINGWKGGKETVNNMTEFSFANAKGSPDIFKEGIKNKINELLK